MTAHDIDISHEIGRLAALSMIGDRSIKRVIWIDRREIDYIPEGQAIRITIEYIEADAPR